MEWERGLDIENSNENFYSHPKSCKHNLEVNKQPGFEHVHFNSNYLWRCHLWEIFWYLSHFSNALIMQIKK